MRFMGNTEAGAVKLSSNTYLALRISFFNEAIADSNLTRKDYIADRVLAQAGYYTAYSLWNVQKEHPVTFGVYPLTSRNPEMNTWLLQI